MGREPYDSPMFDEPMFRTSNGLAPLTLTAEAQGGGTRFDENGDPITPPGAKEGQQDDGGEDDQGSEDMVKTLNALAAAGDHAQLVDFLRTMNQGVTA